MDVVITEWVSLCLRWLHVIAGIAWIGSSFYFVHLDLSLKPGKDMPAGTQGEAWQVHGGGFYNMVKYVVAPARLPPELTWFKWEAYTTWLSGFTLLIVTYYLGANLFLIDKSVADLSSAAAIACSVGGLILSWIVYDLLCRSPLGRNDAALAVVGFVFLVALCVGFTGQSPDPMLGKTAKQRSMHNNYLTLPVVYLMISTHYPLMFATKYNWLIFTIVLVLGFLIRHFYNCRHAGKPNPWWTWVAAAVGMLVIGWLTWAGSHVSTAAAAPPAPVTFAQAQEIVVARCSVCHAAEPVWEGFVQAPKNVLLDTPESILAHAKLIEMNAVLTHAMPPNNVSEISDEDRATLAAWINQGAHGD
jgi:uncharacterized membrane protein